MRSLLITLLLCLVHSTLDAQSQSATVSGHIVGTNAAPLSGVSVELTAANEPQPRAAVTDADGRFTFSAVAPGPYRITAAHPVMQTLVKDGLVLASGETATLSLAMQVAPQRERVDVSAPMPRTYGAERATTATRTAARVHDTPVAVQLVPRDVMDDQQVIAIKEAAKNVSSVLPSTYQFYEAYSIRGFDTGTDVYRNGLRQPSFADQQSVNVEQVEVLKGPAAVLYGRIQPGGMVNVATKRPQAARQTSVQQQVGSFDMFRTTVDTTGAVSKSGTLMYRLGLARQTNDSFVDFVTNESTFLAPMLTWRPGERFELNTELEYQRRTYVHFGTNGGGVPAIGNRPANLPRSTYLGDPSIAVNSPNTQDRDYRGFDWTYALGRSWKVKQRFGYTAVEYETAYAGARALNETTGDMTQTLQGAFQDRKSYATNLDLTGEVSTGAVRHQLLVGVDYYRLKQNYVGLGLSAVIVPLPSINIFNPAYGDNRATLAATPDNSFFVRKEYWTGVYFQDQMRIGRAWHLLLGGRYDDATHGTGSNSVIGGSLDTAWRNLALRNDTAFSPRVGVLYQPVPSVSLYANAVKSFGTNNGISASGAPFEPQQARQYEVGAKSEWFGGALTATAAVYEIVKTNMLTRDLDNPLFSIPIGEARSRGLEVDLSGRINDHLSLIGNLAVDSAVVTRDNNGLQGLTLPGVPFTSGSVWARYTASATGGFSAGSGIYLRDQRQGDPRNTYQLPGYARVDAMASYRFALAGSALTLQLNVQNLFDEVYFDHGGSGGTRLNTYYGDPRTVMGSVQLRF